MSKIGPVDHIPRTCLPWRTEAELTECGKPLTDLPPDRIVTVEQVQKRIRDVGIKRATFDTCVTCMDTAERRHRAGHYPRLAGGTGAVEVLAREIEGLRYAFPPTDPISDHDQRAGAAWARRRRLDAELEAIAALVEAHRDEFDGYLTGRAEAVSLADRRAARRTRSPR